jgi:peptide/nickel transport system substrate-binding protein
MQRRLLLTLLLAFGLVVLAACGAPGGQAPAAEEPAAPAEAPAAAAEAPAAEAPAAAVDAASGIAEYPEPPELDLGGSAVEPLPIDQIVTYKALDEYHEPEWVTALVDAGELPPIEERLPKEPQVMLASGMSNGIGVYGDVWRDFSACPTAGWNNGAGVTSGWFGIESMSFNYQALVKTGPLFRSDQDIEPIPNLAKSWEWSEDGLQLTMHLIEGAKWSDGQPFTADDVIFTWEDLISDPNVVRITALKADAFALDDVIPTLEKVDDFTIKWTFATPKPVHLYYYMDEGDFNVSPAHILKPLHPKYNTGTDYKAFADALPPDDLPVVTMGPWVPVEYKTDELLIMRRNPYFWKVDEAGNQLPYIDEAVYQKGPSGVGRTLCTLSGGCDHTNLENPASEFVEALKRAQEPDAHFIMNWGPELLTFSVQVNQSETLGLPDDNAKAIRGLLREDKFRQALSHAVDRDGIAQSIMRGPFLRAFAGGVYPGSPEFDRMSVVYYPYNVDLSKALLAELGFADTDNNGVLNWSSGPLAGQDLTISMRAQEDAQETVNIAESLVAMFGAVGIKINMRPMSSQANIDTDASGEWDLYVYRGSQDFALPFTRCANLAPLTASTPNWNRQGEGERVLRDWEQEMVDIVNQYCVEQDPATRKDLLSQYNTIFTTHNYTIGVIVGRYGLALAKRFQNVPGGTPTFLYNWVEEAILSEQIWTPVDQQMDQVRPNTIPVYGE